MGERASERGMMAPHHPDRFILLSQVGERALRSLSLLGRVCMSGSHGYIMEHTQVSE